MKNNIKTIWFYDKNKVTEEYCKEVLQPLCIKGSYAGTMFILRNVLKEPYVESEANLLAKMSIPTLIIHDELVKSHIPYVVHASTSSARTEYQ